MPKLPSGLIAGIVTSNASLRANQQGLKITTSTELSKLYSLVDVVYSRGNSMQQWKKNTYFSGHTLADTNLFYTWQKMDQAAFWKWINTDDLNTYFCNLRDDLSKQSDHQVK